jgi:hypothetical protein
VFKENEVCLFVFIVYSGEFEILKKIKSQKAKNDELSSYLGVLPET